MSLRLDFIRALAESLLSTMADRPGDHLADATDRPSSEAAARGEAASAAGDVEAVRSAPVGPGSAPVAPVRGRRGGGRGFGTLFPQLFLIPLLMITVLVLVWLFFVASAQDTRTVGEILQDIEVGGGHARKQDAQALALKVSEKQEEAARAGESYHLSDDETRQLLRIYENAEQDDELRGFFVYALGRAGQFDLVWPLLREMLEADSTSERVRTQAIWGLGLSRDERAVVPLLAQIERFGAPEHWEIRESVVGAVTNILTSGARIAEARRSESKVQLAILRFRRLLGDSRKEVSWNTAIILGKNFGDDAGDAVLRNLVSWEFLDAQRGDQGRELRVDEKEAFMGFALEALYALHGAGVRDLLEEKREDQSLSVRNVALTCLDELEKSGA